MSKHLHLIGPPRERATVHTTGFSEDVSTVVIGGLMIVFEIVGFIVSVKWVGGLVLG